MRRIVGGNGQNPMVGFGPQATNVPQAILADAHVIEKANSTNKQAAHLFFRTGIFTFSSNLVLFSSQPLSLFLSPLSSQRGPSLSRVLLLSPPTCSNGSSFILVILYCNCT